MHGSPRVAIEDRCYFLSCLVLSREFGVLNWANSTNDFRISCLHWSIIRHNLDYVFSAELLRLYKTKVSAHEYKYQHVDRNNLEKSVVSS